MGSLSLKRFIRNKSVIIGGILILIVVFCAVFAPFISPHDPYTMDPANSNQPPSREHPLGTDNLGRDLMTRLFYGARVSLQVGLVAVGFSMTFGVALGLIAGYYGGWIDVVIMRIVDIFLAFPVILLAIAFVAALGAGAFNLMLALAMVAWTQYTRVVRSSVLALKEEEFVLASRTIGASSLRIIMTYILPNALAPIIVMATLGLGTAVITESTLSFLGLGIRPPTASWGNTLNFGLRFIREAPHLSTFPGVAIMLTVLGFNLLGNGIRDVTDPKLSRN